MVPLMITTHHLDFLTQPPLPSTPNHNFSPYPRDIFAQVSNSFPAALFTPCLTMPLGRGPFRPFPSLPWTEESPPKTWGKDGETQKIIDSPTQLSASNPSCPGRGFPSPCRGEHPGPPPTPACGRRLLRRPRRRGHR